MTEDLHPTSKDPFVGAPDLLPTYKDPSAGIPDDSGRRRHARQRLVLILLAIVLLLVALIVPPLISIGRYKAQITQLIATSIGRPVRLSSVELRLLPRPGFVLTDLVVEEDPAFGGEPVLHANAVTAVIRLLALGRGRIEISTISVDEASLNLVRNAQGQWNVDAFFRAAVARTREAAQGRVPPFPYLEATNSRINLKRGLEKLPYSLVNADVSFWQENPGDWRLRLRGQPARTDVQLDLADTGIVRLEASLRRGLELRQMPIHLELEWGEAQLGQLSRLLVGSDPGWRGNLTGQMQLDGTAESARVRTRLSASGVHRAEFAPPEALDFDANCSFVYHFSGRAVDDLACESPLGDGHVRLTGNLPANAEPNVKLDLDHVPAGAGLDLLRTLRSGVSNDLEARGTVSGQLAYAPVVAAPTSPAPLPPARRARKRRAKSNPPPAPLTGDLAVEGFQLSGGGLRLPLEVAKITLQPAAVTQGEAPSLTTSFALPSGGPLPLTITAQLARSGYQVSIRGSASLSRLHELAQMIGLAQNPALTGLAGEPATLDLTAEGPWLPAPPAPSEQLDRQAPSAGPGAFTLLDDAGPDHLSGTMTLHSANFRFDPLPGHIAIAQATLHWSTGQLLWDPVAFAYGPVKGTARLQFPMRCTVPEGCPPELDVHATEIDAAALQAALLGARNSAAGLSRLIERLTPSSPPAWPVLESTVEADTMTLGPVELRGVALALKTAPTDAEITSFDAMLFGGQVHLTGKVSNTSPPVYSMEGTAEGVAGANLCEFLTLRCSGGPISGNGHVDAVGFAAKELADSAKGSIHFEWLRGAFQSDADQDLPTALLRFDRWTANADIGQGSVTLQPNQLQQGRHSTSVKAVITFAIPPQVAFPASEPVAPASDQRPAGASGP